MPEPTGIEGAGPDAADVVVLASSAAHAATISIIECLTKIADHSRLNPFQEQLPSSNEMMQELRRCVTSYAVALRELETPPEGAVVVLKRMLTDTLKTSDPLRGSITDAVVPWVIEAYFPPTTGN